MLNATKPATDNENELLARIEFLEGQVEEFSKVAFAYGVEPSRPKTITGSTTKAHTASGTAYVTVNRLDDGKPFEVFLNVGKAGSDIMELGEAIGRLASLALRHGATLGGVANQLVGIGGNNKFNPPLASAIGKTLTEINGTDWSKNSLSDETLGTVSVTGYSSPAKEQNTGRLCDQCHNFSVVFEEGCEKCHLCGWSAC